MILSYREVQDGCHLLQFVQPWKSPKGDFKLRLATGSGICRLSSASVVWSVALPTAHHVRAAVARFHSRARNSPTAAMLVRRDGGRDGVEECRRRR